MNKLSKSIIFLLSIINIALLFWILIHGKDIAVFAPAGIIAQQQRDIIVFVATLGLSIVIPVIIAAYSIVWKYKSTNTATYTPDWEGNMYIQTGIILFLFVIIGIVFIFDWKSSHDLDPFKPIQAKNQLDIQVVALRWKWLFIYPKQGIATINYLSFPEKTALNFHITADAPMNGFWIPKLGGQVYAMNGMSMPFHLMADGIGTYTGRSTNISGDGFAGMTFTAASTSTKDFDTWVTQIKETAPLLDQTRYTTLAKPTSENKPEYFILGKKDLYNTIIMKYMSPKTMNDTQMHMEEKQ